MSSGLDLDQTYSHKDESVIKSVKCLNQRARPIQDSMSGSSSISHRWSQMAFPRDGLNCKDALGILQWVQTLSFENAARG